MNHDPTQTRMRELGWRRKLTAAEEAELRAWLTAHPEAVAQWAEEAALNELIERLPQSPVSNNFTARVMEDVAREAAAATRQHAQSSPWWRRVLLPRLAFASVILAGGLFAYQRHHAIQEKRMAERLFIVTGTVGDTKELLTVDVLQDFDPIAQLGPRVEPDTELLSLMQ